MSPSSIYWLSFADSACDSSISGNHDPVVDGSCQVSTVENNRHRRCSDGSWTCPVCLLQEGLMFCLCICNTVMHSLLFWFSALHTFTADQWLPSLGRQQSTTKNSGHCCKTSPKQPSMGIMSRENSRGGFPLPSSRFLLSSVFLLDSGLQFYYRHIHAGLLSETAMLPPSCHGGPGTLLCLRTIAF